MIYGWRRLSDIHTNGCRQTYTPVHNSTAKLDLRQMLNVSDQIVNSRSANHVHNYVVLLASEPFRALLRNI